MTRTPPERRRGHQRAVVVQGPAAGKLRDNSWGFDASGRNTLFLACFHQNISMHAESALDSPPTRCAITAMCSPQSRECYCRTMGRIMWLLSRPS
jgi:hypothetical protein